MHRSLFLISTLSYLLSIGFVSSAFSHSAESAHPHHANTFEIRLARQALVELVDEAREVAEAARRAAAEHHQIHASQRVDDLPGFDAYAFAPPAARFHAISKGLRVVRRVEGPNQTILELKGEILTTHGPDQPYHAVITLTEKGPVVRSFELL